MEYTEPEMGTNEGLEHVRKSANFQYSGQAFAPRLLQQGNTSYTTGSVCGAYVELILLWLWSPNAIHILYRIVMHNL